MGGAGGSDGARPVRRGGQHRRGTHGGSRLHGTAAAGTAAKDAAAGAVLLCALAAALVGILLFARPDIWRQILADFLAQPYKIALLVLSVPLVLWFILRGGARDKL